jgi:hypothetical protein
VTSSDPPPREPRLLALDVFRGLTVAAMVLVNNPGSWRHVYAPLRHADWHGWTPTDLIFPFFLFIVGTAIPFALGPRLAPVRAQCGRGDVQPHAGGALEPREQLALRAMRRAASSRPGLLTRSCSSTSRPSASWRPPADRRVLPAAGRVPVVVAGAGGPSPRALPGYWPRQPVPVPGFGRRSRQGQPGRVDRPHGSGRTSGVGACTTRRASEHRARRRDGVAGLLAASGSVAAAARAAGRRSPRGRRRAVRSRAGLGALPINKSLWTSSYAMFTAGAALLVLAACYWAIEMRRWRRWTPPFAALGVNALAVFFLSTLLARLLVLVRVAAADGRARPLQAVLFDGLFLPWAAPASPRSPGRWPTWPCGRRSRGRSSVGDDFEPSAIRPARFAVDTTRREVRTRPCMYGWVATRKGRVTSADSGRMVT